MFDPGIFPLKMWGLLSVLTPKGETKMKKKVFLFITALVMGILMVGCGPTEGQSPSQQPVDTGSGDVKPTNTDFEDMGTYTIEGVYYQNEEMERTLYAKLVVPKDMADGEKRPMVIYIHGGTSDWRALLPVAEYMADKGYIGLSLELAGGMPPYTQPAPKSEGADLYPSHFIVFSFPSIKKETARTAPLSYTKDI